MKLVEELRAEHSLIDRMAGAFRTCLREAASSEKAAADLGHFVGFFRAYVLGYHHTKEEVFLSALVRDGEVPADRGPIAMLSEQHRKLMALLEEIASAAPGAAMREALAERYSRLLWQHVDAENSVLLPEGETRLRRKGVFELDAPAASPETKAVELDAQQLLERYPRFDDATFMRGDGCVLCPAYGDPCEGIEREWWNENEWEDFFARDQ